MATSKLDYLKRYMSQEDEGAKKAKKRRKKPKSGSLKIVDEEVLAVSLADEEDDDVDEKPIVEDVENLEPPPPAPSKWKSFLADESGATARSLSPVGKKRIRHDSDSDLSPPIKNVRSDGMPQLRRRRRHDSEDDLPSEGKRRRRNDNSGENDTSSLRRRKGRHDSDSEGDSRGKSQSSRHSDSDGSPSKRKQGRGKSQKEAKEGSSAREPHKKTGLRTGRDVQKDLTEQREQADKAFKSLDASQTGERAATVYRDKHGHKLDVALEKKRRREAEEEKAAEMEKYMEWGRGLVQKKETEQKVDDMLHEMSKPLARGRDDADLDRMLRQQDREGDPMAGLLQKKKASSAIPEKPVWKGPFPPNRFNIRPGYRWDGVDRSNGFEKKLFAAQSDRRATSEIAYQWSVEDM